MTCPCSPYGTAMSFSMTIPGRFSNRCSGGRPPRDSGVLRGPRNRYSVVVSSTELLQENEGTARPRTGRPTVFRSAVRPTSLEVGHRLVALAVVLLHDHGRHRRLTGHGGVH